MRRDHSFLRQIFPNSMGQFAKFRGSPQQIFHLQQLIFYDPGNRPHMQYLSSVSYASPQLTDTVCLPNKQAIFQISSVFYFHGRLNPTKICCIFSLSTGHSTTFCINVEIPQEQQILWLSSKFRILRKTVVPRYVYMCYKHSGIHTVVTMANLT